MKYKMKKAYSHMMEITEKRPVDINIETTNNCVLKCRFCCNRLYVRPHTIMDMKLFEKICLEYKDIGGGHIGISSMHADLMTDPLLMERIKILKPYRDIIQLSTTTPLLLMNKYSDDEMRLFLEGFSCIQISVSGTDRDSYKAMVGIDGFEQLATNLDRLHNIAKKYNLNDRLHLYFRTFDVTHLYTTDFYKKLANIYHVQEVRDSYFDWSGTIQMEDLPSGAHLYKADNRLYKDDCVVPLATLSVEVDGSVVGCGCIDWNKEYVVGNCKDSKLLEIWQSKKSLYFRHGFSSEQIPEMCKMCGLYYSALNAFSKPCLTHYKPSDGIYYMLED